jgi:hypothetical protein
MRLHRIPVPARVLAGAAVALLGLGGLSRAIDSSGIKTQTLGNGMKVVLWPDHSISNLARTRSSESGLATSAPGSRAFRTSSST